VRVESTTALSQKNAATFLLSADHKTR